jgi:hypothetical protein
MPTPWIFPADKRNSKLARKGMAEPEREPRVSEVSIR